MATRAGYALLAALVALAALISLAVVLRATGPLEVSRRPDHGRDAATAPASLGRWVGTWSASPAAAEPEAPAGHPDTSIRNVVHASLGGPSARVQISNAHGTKPLTVAHATIALAAAPGSRDAAPGSMRELAFHRARSVTVPAGGSVLSDAAALAVPDAADLLITTYTAAASGAVTYHPHARQNSYLARADHASDASGDAFTEQSPYWRYITAVDVWAPGGARAIVALGDSITDGFTSTAGANHRWPDYLAGRLLARRGARRFGVLNEGLSGNRILADAPAGATTGLSALRRLDRDALSRSGAAILVVDLGINDILVPPRQTDPERILDGLRRIAGQARARGLRVIGGTLLPFEGNRSYAARPEAVRRAVNREIRAGTVFDSVVDFDRALRDPSRPTRLRPAYDCGDHLHPSDDGYRVMAAAVDARLHGAFRPVRYGKKGSLHGKVETSPPAGHFRNLAFRR